MTISLLVTDGNCVPVGDPIAGWTNLVATPTWNAVGSGTATVPATDAIREQLTTTRARLLVIRNGVYFMGGPVEQNGFDWDGDQAGSGGTGDTSEPGQLTVNFADDFATIANEVSYPNPAQAANAQTAAFYAPASTNAETLMRNIVNLNVGPGALTARIVPHLVLGSSAGVGTNVVISTRFEQLGDLLRRIALAGGNLGFRTVQDSNNTIVFTVYSPADLSNAIRFSRGLSNLRKIKYAPSAPTCNVAIVGGDGTGASRTIRERIDSASVARYGRIVKWVNQSDTSDTTIMDQAGDQALADGAESAQVSFTAIDTPGQQYGVNYALGNLVTLTVWPGLDIVQQVRAVTLTADPNTGEVVTPIIGSDSAITDSRTLDILRQIDSRVGYTEKG